MRLPLWIVIMLPEKMQKRFIQNVWDNRTDQQIMEAHDNAVEWIGLSKGRMACSSLTSIADSSQDRLDKYILPQMRKRWLM